MTDEPATTPAVDHPWAIPDLTQAEKDDLMAALAEMRQPTDPRVTALTLRIGQLREQRDEEHRQWFLMRDERDDAERQRDRAQLDAGVLAQERDRARWERDEARAQVVACQTAADDLRHRIEVLAIALEEAEIADMIDHHSGDVAALLGPDGAGSAHRAANSASVDPPAADALDEALAKLVRVAVLHQPTDADECPVCTTEDGMSYASPCPTLRAVRAPGGAGSAHRVETGASATPDLLGPQIGAESLEEGK